MAARERIQGLGAPCLMKSIRSKKHNKSNSFSIRDEETGAPLVAALGSWLSLSPALGVHPAVAPYPRGPSLGGLPPLGLSWADKLK